MKPIDSAQYKDWLPKAIGAYNFQEIKNRRSKSLHATYRMDAGGYLTYQITDGAQHTNMVNLFHSSQQFFEDEDNGYSTNKNINKNGVPITVTKNGDRDVQLEFIWDDRFLITLHGSNISEEEMWALRDDFQLKELSVL